jgi:hypothetical protein
MHYKIVYIYIYIYIYMSRDQNAGRSYSMRIDNSPIERVDLGGRVRVGGLGWER